MADPHGFLLVSWAADRLRKRNRHWPREDWRPGVFLRLHASRKSVRKESSNIGIVRCAGRLNLLPFHRKGPLVRTYTIAPLVLGLTAFIAVDRAQDNSLTGTVVEISKGRTDTGAVANTTTNPNVSSQPMPTTSTTVITATGGTITTTPFESATSCS